MSTVLQTSVTLRGKPIPGALDRQVSVPDFDQEAISKAQVFCIGAGGLVSNIAPALARKGIGKLTLFDDDRVEASNLNRQRFYERDIGQNKAVALAANLQLECVSDTLVQGRAVSLQQAVENNSDLNCSVVVCGVDNNAARCLASTHFRKLGIPVVFCAVSADATHGYVFVQEITGPCFGCLFPDSIAGKEPCPATPAIGEILQLIGALNVYAVDTLLTKRKRDWICRIVDLRSLEGDGSINPPQNKNCLLCSATNAEGV